MDGLVFFHFPDRGPPVSAALGRKKNSTDEHAWRDHARYFCLSIPRPLPPPRGKLLVADPSQPAQRRTTCSPAKFLSVCG